MAGNSTGGVLHVVLDDMNVEDTNIDWCLNNHLKDGWRIQGPGSQGYQEAAREIADLMRPLSCAQRAFTIWSALRGGL